MTGWGSVDLAVEAMRRGVRDFVQKPWDNGHLLATLRTEIEEGRARRLQVEYEQRELHEALRIQRKLLPASMPQIDGVELATSWQPASGVGGDCFDAIAFGRTKLAVSIADVVGKGIPAALLMSNLQATVRAFATGAEQPAELCQQVNRDAVRTHRRRAVHQFLLLRDRHGSRHADVLQRRPLPAACWCALMDPSIVSPRAAPCSACCRTRTYEQGQLTIGSGDRLVLYTDGITEARNDADEEFGEDRLLEFAIENRACSAPALQARLGAFVTAFTGGQLQDDATLIVVAVE